MSTYTTLRNESSGDEVKKLQQALVDAGYNVGSSGVDGIYGSATTAAVRKYQQDNNLQVDGIAGSETLGSLYTTKTPETTLEVGGTDTSAVPEQPKYAYDATANDAYMQALQALQQAQSTMPSYAGTYDKQLEDLYHQIVNRKDFSYNINRDALYQQYADQYRQQGQLAMMDTMGQAAALTGGYGNSYAQSVGQQSYQAYLQQLNDVVPELYGMALDQYNQEGQNMLNQYAMLGDMANTEYGRYQDALSQYWQNLSYQKQAADDAYNRGYNEWLNEYQMGVNADATAYEKQQNAYSNLVNLIAMTGYTPTAEELKAAGMSQEQATAYANYYSKQSSSSYSGGGYVGNVDNGALTTSQVKKLQTALGITADGMWGPESQSAAEKKLGVSSADDAWEKYQQNIRDRIEGNEGGGVTSFTGSTYSEAAAYLKTVGKASAVGGLMDQATWQRHKNKNNSAGGEHEASSYKEYLAAYIYGVMN